MEQDLVLDTTDTGQPYPIQIINSQVELILSVMEMDDLLYDDIKADKIVVISKAFKVIHKAQKALDKFL
jgi:hypothetical protein